MLKRLPTGRAVLFGLFLFVLWLFRDPLFSSDPDRIISLGGQDLDQQFVHWLGFGFGQLRAGRLPLWNPHIFSGAPFLGGFQSAIFYPPNLIFLCLPLPRAINWSVALHIFLIGLFVHRWAVQRGYREGAAILSAVTMMLSGPFFLAIFPGHMPNLWAMTWAPLIFLSVDGWLEGREIRRLLIGAGAVALQILAGHPQYVFYTAIAAAIFFGVSGWLERRLVRSALALAGAYSGGLALSAVQLVHGWRVGADSIRGGALSLEYARRFSLPPENLLTALGPGIFGPRAEIPYWGLWFFWETTIFIGIIALALALSAAFSPSSKKTAPFLAAGGACLLLALGGSTPLFSLLYHWVPGFDRFRGISKFAFPFAVFFSMLAGWGFDRLHALTPAELRRRSTASLIGGCLLAGGGALVVLLSWKENPSWVHVAAGRLRAAAELAGTASSYSSALVQRAGENFGRDIALSGALLAALGMVLRFARSIPIAESLVLLLCLGEAAARVPALPTFESALASEALVEELKARDPGDYRIHFPGRADEAMTVGSDDIGGLDALVPRRYLEFLNLAAGAEPARETLPEITQRRPLLRLLRLRYILRPGAAERVAEPALPRAFLVRDWKVARTKAETFALLGAPSFDPARTGIVEEDPEFPVGPDAAQKDYAKAAEISNEALAIEVSVSLPALLIVADSYARGWTAPRPYRVLPVDHALRGVPLGRGRHRFVMRYEAPGLTAGAAITALSLLLFAVVWIVT